MHFVDNACLQISYIMIRHKMYPESCNYMEQNVICYVLQNIEIYRKSSIQMFFHLHVTSGNSQTRLTRIFLRYHKGHECCIFKTRFEKCSLREYVDSLQNALTD